jgi:hypothetical protein
MLTSIVLCPIPIYFIYIYIKTPGSVVDVSNSQCNIILSRSRRGHDRMVVWFTTTGTCALNPVHGDVYFIQYYVIKLATGLWFSPDTPVSSTNKIDRHDIAEISQKLVLNIITPTLLFMVPDHMRSVHMQVKFFYWYIDLACEGSISVLKNCKPVYFSKCLKCKVMK